MRMMNAIENAEVAVIETGTEGGLPNGKRWYQLRNLPGTPNIRLTGNEVENLALCRDLLERLLPEGVEKVIAESIAKISTLMEQAEKRADATAPKAGRISWGRIDYAPFQKHMEVMLKAVAAHTVCEVRYRELEYRFPDRDRAPQLYNFVPVRLTSEDEALNVEGWLVEERGTPNVVHPLTLAVHRILSCHPTRLNLKECPPLPKHEGAFGLVGYKAFPAHVAFCEEFSGFIRDRIWSDGQEIIDLPDGGVALRFMVADENELLGWVMRFGNGAELLEPRHLRRRLQEELGDMLDMYAGEEE
jgi:predicted DNA-binding transcriptional regulator YafY